ncbi:ribonucleoside-diphosphate reductase, adenosylcobalamin-dependent [Microgenomates group bacterium RBG_16_45_19]|nr:MAG: ribonucleoside-diphosphate reductase, adenosylcobalamin-dependent [Microgenomates group bacterium RBG_16_45_19]
MKALPENAQKVMVRRYAVRNEQGEPAETAAQILERAARVVAEAEQNYQDGVTYEQVRRRFTQLLQDFRFIPNGRTLANAGTSRQQLANCFVLPIEDEMGKTNEGIFSILRQAVLILQAGGGVGFSFGRIRPKGDTAGRGKATGAVSFLKVFDTAFWVIGQGGGRRSACMAVLPVHHPDIFDFIHCKETEGVIEHFNISVGVTDEFMRAVETDGQFALINPRDGQVWRQVRARDLFTEIIKYAHHNGEPGVLFLDAANRQNPVPNQYQLEATNPCGEQWLGPYENCCMASINLSEHTQVNELKSQNAKLKTNEKLFNKVVDWEKLAETVEWTTRWLDDVVDANEYVPAVPQLEEAAHKNRRIGVSIMGLADLMYLIGVRYGSEAAIDLAGQIMEFIRYQTMKTSIALAEDRGPFPGITGSIYDPSARSGQVNKWKIPKPIKPYKHKFGRPKLDWQALLKELKLHGIRNSCQTTIQPTGAIATISGLEGYGCEPVFALSYIMKTHEGAEEKGEGSWAELFYESKWFSQALKTAALSSQERQTIFEAVRVQGSCQKVALVPKHIRQVFVVSSDVTVEEHVKMQAALQAFVDNAISKTINFPEGASEADVWQAYFKGWKLGLKGMTVYVTGSRQTVVLETKETRLSRGMGKVKPTEIKEKGPKDREPFRVNGNGIVGKTLHKVYPQDLTCAECGAMMILQEGCATCPACGSTHCAV